MPVEDNVTMRNDELWVCFHNWCIDNQINSDVTKTALSQYLTSKGFKNESKRYSDGIKRTWKGLAFKNLVLEINPAFVKLVRLVGIEDARKVMQDFDVQIKIPIVEVENGR